MTGEKNPYGSIPDPSNQYPEARSFVRLYTKNPHAQARLLETLLGLQKIPAEGWTNTEQTQQEKRDAARVVAQTIKYVAEQFPEWRTDGYVSDTDSNFGLPDYHPEERLVYLVDAVIEQVNSGTWQ